MQALSLSEGKKKRSRRIEIMKLRVFYRDTNTRVPLHPPSPRAADVPPSYSRRRASEQRMRPANGAPINASRASLSPVSRQRAVSTHTHTHSVLLQSLSLCPSLETFAPQLYPSKHRSCAHLSRLLLYQCVVYTEERLCELDLLQEHQLSSKFV